MRILYAASNMQHINSFHRPYIYALRNEGHDLKIMARGGGADFNIPFEKKVFSFKNSECRKKIREIVAREGFDAIILNTSLAAYHVRRALDMHDRPRVVNFVHGYLFPLRGMGVKDRMLLYAEKSLKCKTDRILVMNKEDLEIAKRYRLSLSEPVLTRGMGAVCGEVRAEREHLRASLGAGGKLVLSFVGELSERKNQRMLIEALPILKKRVQRVALWLIGDGGAVSSLRGLASRLGVSNSVLFTGRRDNPCDFIRASDVYVSAARIEGMPFNVIEALGVGTPIVASDIKGHRDLLSGGAGLLYPLGDKEKFVECVLTASARNEKMLKLGAQVYHDYSFEEVFSSTYRAVKEAIFCE